MIGTYDPLPKPDPYETSARLHKDIKLDQSRAKYWIGVGAQPTDPVWRLLNLVCARMIFFCLISTHSSGLDAKEEEAWGKGRWREKLRCNARRGDVVPSEKRRGS